LLLTHFSKKINHLKSNNGGEYGNDELITVLETTDIILELLQPYAPVCNSIPKKKNHTILTLLQSMTCDCPNLIQSGLLAEACSSNIDFKNGLDHSAG
jgi:hypothetical protein